MSDTMVVRELKRQIELTEADVRTLQRRVFEAEERALRAERAAREAWAFARTILHRPPVLTR